MRTLFVYTDINVKGGAKSYHFGVGILSAALKRAGFPTSLQYMYDHYDPQGLLARIERESPGLLAFTGDSTQFPYVKKLLDEIGPAARKRGIVTLIGGTHASLYPDCINESPYIDVLCRGEGEDTIVELVQHLAGGRDFSDVRNLWVKRADGEIIKNPMRPFIEDLDALPFSDRDPDFVDYQAIIDSDFDRVMFMLSRGCPYSCTYCGSPAMGKLQEGKYVRFLSVDRAIAELKDIQARFKFKTIFFADDVFTINRKFVFEFAERYREEIGVPFEVTTRVESSSPDVFQALADAGCTRVAMGIESGDEEFRRAVLNRRMSNDKIVKSFAWAKEAGLSTKSYNIVGFPHETPEIHRRTVELNRRLDVDSNVCYIFQPYPGTALFDVCKDNHLFKEDAPVTEIVSRTDTVLELPAFKREDVLKSYRNFAFEVYKGKSWRKALLYKVYYSRFGEALIRLLAPIKKFIRNLAMGT